MIYENLIRRSRARAAFFEGRIGGAAGVDAVEDMTAPLTMPAGYWVPMGEEAGPNDGMNGVYQTVRERYAFLAVLDLTTPQGKRDQLGHAAVVALKHVKPAILGAVMNFVADPERMPKGLEYEGYDLVAIVGKVRAIYEFRFVAETLLTDEDGTQETYPNFEGMDGGVDVINPAFDPNNDPENPGHNPDQPNPRPSGPDDRIEAPFKLNLPTA